MIAVTYLWGRELCSWKNIHKICYLKLWLKGRRQAIYRVFGAIFAITSELVKLRRQAHHCKKGFLTAHHLRSWWHVCDVRLVKNRFRGRWKSMDFVQRRVERRPNTLEKLVLHTKFGHDPTFKKRMQNISNILWDVQGEKSVFRECFWHFSSLKARVSCSKYRQTWKLQNILTFTFYNILLTFKWKEYEEKKFGNLKF